MTNTIHKYLLTIALGFIPFLAKADAKTLIINEVVSENRTGMTDNKGNYHDWIEIYNNSAQLIDLTDYILTDDPQNIDVWHFPNIKIAPYAYLIIYASGDSSTHDELHANFKISNNEDIIKLYDADAKLIDQIKIPELREDISYGYASKKLSYFNIPTPGAENNTTAYIGYLPPPTISHPSGFYSEDITVSATHETQKTTLRYTLDGSTPTASSPILSSSLLFTDPSHQPDYISKIKTNPSFDYPQNGFDEKRADSRGWLPPYTVSKKSNVLQVKAFKEEYIPSNATNSTFFVFPDSSDTYSMPVLSLTTNKEHLFDDSIGIYVYGTTGPEGNYKESGDAWERPTFLQFFENDGSLAFEQHLGARIHGGGGRHSTIKNLRMYARDEYGKDKVNYQFFEESDMDEFERFIIRGPGHRPDCSPRDDLADLLLKNQDMDIQHMRPVILFINGEYWGIHTIKERFDQQHLAARYGKDDDDYVIMKNRNDIDAGEIGDDQHYFDLINFADTSDMALQNNYNYVNTQMDIDNYISYLAFEIYMGNVDWVITNIRFWRYKGADFSTAQNNPLDGRWRWFMFDFDLVFGGSCASITPYVNVMDDTFDASLGTATMLARGLKRNPQFSKDFINRMCDLMNSTFNDRNFRKRVDEIDQSKTPEMLEHIERWRYPSSALTLADRLNEVPTLAPWTSILDTLKNYPKSRKRKIIDQLTDEFGLSDTLNISIDVNDKKMGQIKLNSILLSEQLDGVSTAVYPWTGTYFNNIPIAIKAMPLVGYKFVRWEGVTSTSDSLSLLLNGNFEIKAIFEVDSSDNYKDILYINEIMASNNKTIRDEYNAYADWVEIYNPNDKAIDLSGYFISDDSLDIFKYQIPSDASKNTIAPKGYKLIWCDDKSDRGTLHTNFKLNSANEELVLTSPDSTIIDQISFDKQKKDTSFGRSKDGEDAWRIFPLPYGATPNKTNNEPANAVVEHKRVNKITLYPNPVNRGDIVHFNRETSFGLYNSLGQCLQSRKDATQLETNNLSPGLYLLYTEGHYYNKLIVK